jgi:outer membrane lipoprotein LolB
MRRCFFVCAAFALNALVACTSVQMPPGAPTAAIGQSVLAQHFSLNGRISVRVNDKLDSGQIRWQRGADEERIGLYSPLGSQVAELFCDNRTHVVTLRQSAETVTATSVQELTRTMLGVPLDLDRLAEWVQGFGLRENEMSEVALANGDIWRVTVERYQSSGRHRYASRVTAIKGDMVVRLVVDEWTPQ